MQLWSNLSNRCDFKASRTVYDSVLVVKPRALSEPASSSTREGILSPTLLLTGLEKIKRDEYGRSLAKCLPHGRHSGNNLVRTKSGPNSTLGRVTHQKLVT